MEHEPIVMERVYNAPIQKVWEAITSKEQMKQWYFNVSDFEPKVGFEFSFEGGAEDRIYVHLCKVLEVEKERRLTYSWRYQGFEGDSYLTWELFEEGEKTRLILTHAGLETFPSSNPDFVKGNFEQGWTSILETSLKNYVEETKVEQVIEEG